jgi:hypothetical protein
VDPQRVLAALLHLAEHFGLEVKHCTLRGFHPGAGGLCKVNGKSVVLLNSKASLVERTYALAEALRPLDLGSLDIDPELKSFLARGRRQSPEPAVGDRTAHRPSGRLGPGLASTAHRRHRRPQSR